MTSFSIDPKNDCLTERKLLEGFCRGTYPNTTVLFVNTTFIDSVPHDQYSGSMLDLLNSVCAAAKDNTYFMLSDRIVPVLVHGDIDQLTINSLRNMVYNHTFAAFWWLGELAYWND